MITRRYFGNVPPNQNTYIFVFTEVGSSLDLSFSVAMVALGEIIYGGPFLHTADP